MAVGERGESNGARFSLLMHSIAFAKTEMDFNHRTFHGRSVSQMDHGLRTLSMETGESWRHHDLTLLSSFVLCIVSPGLDSRLSIPATIVFEILLSVLFYSVHAAKTLRPAQQWSIYCKKGWQNCSNKDR